MTCEPDTETPMLTKCKTVPNYRMYVTTISVCLGAVCAGSCLSWTAPAFSHLLDNNSTNSSSPGFTITNSESGLIGSMLTIGALVAALPIGYLADKFGRKKTILLLAAPFIINWTLVLSAKNMEMLVAGRFFAGMGLGGICVTVPMYIGEIAQSSNRGFFGSFFAMFICTGILLTCIIGSFTNWLGLNLILGFLPIMFAVVFYFMPETPFYLVKMNKTHEAELILKELRGRNYDVTNELAIIEKEIRESQEKSASIKDIVTSKANLKAVICSVGILAFQQLSGINAVVFYTVPIFKAAGSTMSPFLASILINSVQVIICYVSILVIERANRKFYLMLSSAGMLICLAGLGMYFHLRMLNIPLSNVGFIPLASTVLFMVFFCIGFGSVPWLLMHEILSPEIKGIASGFAVLTNWSFAFVVTFCFPLMNASLGGHVTFYLFALFNACATLFVLFVVPETRGKNLLEIQEALGR